jgi:hypothetical protein
MADAGTVAHESLISAESERSLGLAPCLDADLGFSDPDAATFGRRFDNAGFRFTFKLTKFHEGTSNPRYVPTP